MEINNIDRSRYEILMSRYEQFRNNMADVNKEEVKVFDPLSKKHLEELQLIREVTKELQNKLQEDLKKQAAAEIAAKEKPVENAVPPVAEEKA